MAFRNLCILGEFRCHYSMPTSPQVIRVIPLPSSGVCVCQVGLVDLHLQVGGEGCGAQSVTFTIFRLSKEVSDNDGDKIRGDKQKADGQRDDRGREDATVNLVETARERERRKFVSWERHRWPGNERRERRRKSGKRNC